MAGKLASLAFIALLVFSLAGANWTQTAIQAGTDFALSGNQTKTIEDVQADATSYARTSVNAPAWIIIVLLFVVFLLRF